MFSSSSFSFWICMRCSVANRVTRSSSSASSTEIELVVLPAAQVADDCLQLG